jgi:hypothetical protein
MLVSSRPPLATNHSRAALDRLWSHAVDSFTGPACRYRRWPLSPVFHAPRASLPQHSSPDGAPHRQPTHARLGCHVLASTANPPCYLVVCHRRLAPGPVGPRSNRKRTPHLPPSLSFVRHHRCRPPHIACTHAMRPLAAHVVSLTSAVTKQTGRSFFLS